MSCLNICVPGGNSYTPAVLSLYCTPHTCYDFPIVLTKKILSPHEIVFWFREQGLPISIIASIARVERKTVYSWLEHGEMRLQNQERMERLYGLLSINEKTRLVNFYRFWNRKLKSQTTLGDLLKEEIINDKLLEEAFEELWPHVKKYHDLAIYHPKKGLGINPLLDEIPEVF